MLNKQVSFLVLIPCEEAQCGKKHVLQASALLEAFSLIVGPCYLLTLLSESV